MSDMTKHPDLPWTKREILDAMKAVYVPARTEDAQTWAFFVIFKAFAALALGQAQGSRSAIHRKCPMAATQPRFPDAGVAGEQHNLAFTRLCP